MRPYLSVLVLSIGFFGFVLSRPARAVEVDVTLRGSPNSMVRQNQVARTQGYEFVRDRAELDSLVRAGLLVPVEGNGFYEVLDGVSYPYARPEVRLFIERLGEQYFEGTGERLVVTSLTRPQSNQPRNSHELSVHPAGIAIDLRLSSQRRSRAWLESVLLRLESRRVLDVTRERYPPHYHVAIFPDEYRGYLAGMIGEEALAEALRFEVEEEVEPERPARVASLPVVNVVSTAPVPRTDFAWTVVVAGAPVVLLLLMIVSILRRSVPARR